MKKSTQEMINEQTARVKRLEAKHEKMKEINAFYRKHNTLHGCPHQEMISPWKYSVCEMPSSWKPFSAMDIQNDGRTLQRARERLSFLKERAAMEKAAERKKARDEQKGMTAEQTEKDREKKRGRRPSVKKKLQENKEELGRIGYVAEQTTEYLKTGAAKTAPSR